jgi:hypothetical protein
MRPALPASCRRFERLFSVLLPAALTWAALGCENRTPSPPEICTADCPAEDPIRRLAEAYRTRDLELFVSALVKAPEAGAEYLFIPSPDSGLEPWGFAEEVRLHRRLFHPESPAPGEDPCPAELWRQSVDATFVQLSPYAEREDLYRSETNPGGLDPRRWRAADARYASSFFIAGAGDLDYQVEGVNNFVILEDLSRSGSPDRRQIYIWEEISGSTLPRRICP